jgi:hypothetical protein
MRGGVIVIATMAVNGPMAALFLGVDEDIVFDFCFGRLLQDASRWRHHPD